MDASPKNVLALCLIVLIVGSLATALGGCAGSTPVSVETSTSIALATTTAAPTTTLAPTTALAPTTTSTSTNVPTLSTRQMAGQRVIYSYPGLTPPAALLSLISHGEAAGVIFFSDNVSSKEQIRGVINALTEAAADPGNPVRAPLLFMVDQEGGKVRRLPGAPLLSEKQIGASTDPRAQAAKAGNEAGLNLRSAGMNVNLAPVLDVYRKAGGFNDRSGRSYSTDPDVVSELGAKFIEAQQRVGVAATVKHFPGLGAAGSAQNTDLGAVTLNVSKTSLRSVDEHPYKEAIAVGVRLVMVSWAVYPALDPRLPAGLSPTIVQGELRERLGFRGVTITDALGTTALKAFGTTRHRAVLAAKAGMDLILTSARDVSDGERAGQGLEAGYLDGTLGHADFQAALRRIIELRFSLAG